MSTTSSSDSAALVSAKLKLVETNTISYENLPTDRGDSLWNRIETKADLTLDEISALKNAVCQGGAASNAAAGISLVLEQAQVKENFVRLLEQSSIVSGQNNGNRFEKTVALALMKHYNTLKGCTTKELAKDLYNQLAFLTTTTINRYEAQGVVLDGEVPGACSTHSHFIRVLDKCIKVFKHPKEINDIDQVKKIAKDVEVFNILKDLNGGVAVPGLVCYESFSITTTAGHVIPGHLSDVYTMTLADIRVGVDSSFLCNIFKPVLNSLRRVHTLGYVMCDVKPGNLFLKNDMTVHIADFGGCVALGAPIEEYTMEFIPEEFISQGACFAIDWYCLASSFLFMMGKQVSNPSVANIKNAILNLNDNAAQDFLRQVLEYESINKCSAVV